MCLGGASGIVAGMLVQNALKYMLKFGTIAHYVGYAALTDFYPTMRLHCNKDCENGACRAAQKAFLASGKKTLLPWEPSEAEEVQQAPIHEDNDWGISCDDGGDADNSTADAADVEIASKLAEGVELQYMRTAEVGGDEDVSTEQRVDTKGQSVAQMMAALRASQNK